MKRRKKNIIPVYKGKNQLTFTRWPFGYLFIFLMLAACMQKRKAPDYTNQYRKIHAVLPLLHNGDLIVRNGTDETSDAARKFNREDTSFSHCGIIFIEEDTAFVYHSIGGKYNPDQGLMRQPMDSFCNPLENNRFAVYRHRMNDHQSALLKLIANKYYAEKLPFDIFFNFDTDDRMYCSEFVYKCYNSAMNGGSLAVLHTNPKPLFVSIDDLYLHTNAVLVERVDY
jgi:hypothetical protein